MTSLKFSWITVHLEKVPTVCATIVWQDLWLGNDGFVYNIQSYSGNSYDFPRAFWQILLLRESIRNRLVLGLFLRYSVNIE